MYTILIQARQASGGFPLKKKWGFELLGTGGRLTVCMLISLLLVLFSVSVCARPLSANLVVTPKDYRDSLTMDVLRHGRVSIGYLFYYPSSISIGNDIRHNPQLMSRLDELFDIALHDTLISFDRAELTGSASIEGSRQNNEILSRERAYSLRNFLEGRYRLSSYLATDVRWTGEDWDGLAGCVRQVPDDRFAWKSEVLSIIAKTSNPDRRETLLKKLDGGRPYAYMRTHFFPLQRRAIITLTCNLQRLAEKRLNRRLDADEVERVVTNALLPASEAAEFLADRSIVSRPVKIPYGTSFEERITDAFNRLKSSLQAMETPLRDTIRVAYNTVVQTQQTDTLIIDSGKHAPYHFAAKTNLLFDVALLPNVALEFPLPGGWSTEVEAQWAWWNTGGSKRYFYRIQTLGVEARKWFGTRTQQPLNGHYLGVYIMGGTYDLRWKEANGSQSDFSISAGISYGYSIRLAHRWNLELGISAGYLGGKYYRYHFDGANNRYPWESTHRLHYFGPTKAKVSLVYRIGALQTKE
ncbi:MAG: DUF3575 domain-containing protein [Prevotellaceae bacterium]|jgi:hypothetical protein|nr:DUF3575 domain-containing protein [Prevotellaceae bacterium]